MASPDDAAMAALAAAAEDNSVEFALRLELAKAIRAQRELQLLRLAGPGYRTLEFGAEAKYSADVAARLAADITREPLSHPAVLMAAAQAKGSLIAAAAAFSTKARSVMDGLLQAISSAKSAALADSSASGGATSGGGASAAEDEPAEDSSSFDDPNAEVRSLSKLEFLERQLEELKAMMAAAAAAGAMAGGGAGGGLADSEAPPSPAAPHRPALEGLQSPSAAEGGGEAGAATGAAASVAALSSTMTSGGGGSVVSGTSSVVSGPGWAVASLPPRGTMSGAATVANGGGRGMHPAAAALLRGRGIAGASEGGGAITAGLRDARSNPYHRNASINNSNPVASTTLDNQQSSVRAVGSAAAASAAAAAVARAAARANGAAPVQTSRAAPAPAPAASAAPDGDKRPAVSELLAGITSVKLRKVKAGEGGGPGTRAAPPPPSAGAASGGGNSLESILRAGLDARFRRLQATHGGAGAAGAAKGGARRDIASPDSDVLSPWTPDSTSRSGTKAGEGSSSGGGDSVASPVLRSPLAALTSIGARSQSSGNNNKSYTPGGAGAMPAERSAAAAGIASPSSPFAALVGVGATSPGGHLSSPTLRRTSSSFSVMAAAAAAGAARASARAAAAAAAAAAATPVGPAAQPRGGSDSGLCSPVSACSQPVEPTAGTPAPAVHGASTPGAAPVPSAPAATGRPFLTAIRSFRTDTLRRTAAAVTSAGGAGTPAVDRRRGAPAAPATPSGGGGGASLAAAAAAAAAGLRSPAASSMRRTAGPSSGAGAASTPAPELARVVLRKTNRPLP